MSTELVRQASRGDRDAFTELVLARFDALYGLARLVAGNVTIAEDALQEALTRAWRDLPRLRDPERVDAWLRRLVINACHDQWRWHRRHPADRLEAAPEPADLATPLVEVEDRDYLLRALRLLSPEDRAVLALRYYLDLSSEDGAAVMRMRPATYRSRIHRALRSLGSACGRDGRANRLTASNTREVPE